MHSRLEQYLEQVARRLQALPPARRDEEIQEIQEHLLALVAAAQESASQENQAVEAAIRQFGTAEEVSRALMRAWRRAHRPLRDSLFAATVCAVYLLHMSWIGDGLYSLAYRLVYSLHGPNLPHSYIPWIYIGFAAMAGWITGVVFPRRAMAATVLANLLLVGLLLLGYSSAVLIDGIDNAQVLPMIERNREWVLPQALWATVFSGLGSLCGRWSLLFAGAGK